MTKSGLFKVMLRGDGFLLELGPGKPACGFYRNVYVLAADAASAIERAKKQQLDQLYTGEYAGSIRGITEANLAIEEIEESWAYWKLFRPEGHVFYDTVDEEDVSLDKGRKDS